MCSGEEAAAALTTALDALDEQKLTDLPDHVLRAQLLDLLTQTNRLHAQLARRTAAFDTRALASDDACRTTRSWLRAFGRLSHTAAGAYLKAGRLLRELPHLDAAARAGHVSAEHLTRVVKLADRVGVDDLQQADQPLADAATSLNPHDLQQVCDRARHYLDPDGDPPDPYIDYQRRAITLSRFDGMVLIRGQLDPEGGAALLTALDAYTAPPNRTVPPHPNDERTPAQRRADALVELARTALHAGATPRVAGTRPQIGILLTPEVLAGTTGHAAPRRTRPGHPDTEVRPAVATATAIQSPPPTPQPTHNTPHIPATHIDGSHDQDRATSGIPPTPDAAWLEWFGEISHATTARIGCDADFWRIVLDPTTGLPLDLGRRHRLVPHWIRKALWARDRGCRFPGCDAPTAWTDAHHFREPWATGGRTDVDNLILLCRHHHVLVHEGQWTIQLHPDTGAVTAARPNGKPYEIPASRPCTRPREPLASQPVPSQPGQDRPTPDQPRQGRSGHSRSGHSQTGHSQTEQTRRAV